MLVTKCGKCKTVIVVPYGESMFSRFAGIFPCINEVCNGVARRGDETDIAESDHPVGMTPEDYFQRVHATGINAPMNKVSSKLLNHRIVDFDLEPAGQENERTIINMLRLEDGTQLLFGSSGRGACIYKIEEPDAENDDLSSKTNPGV